ncbi:hypothetical protein MGU_11671 [Metarhizium guizhouense ARSEF 977]|uniref:Uncharacterized protein n=1 Tax=Metarhizium guizhouense (strain ARSEF 977) TaxID=1276136 RepID=A0A0B4G2Z7_METGA|nr:hypothetical protein MGU_11671 [Metarhizium guizhouense ARSEF 977]
MLEKLHTQNRLGIERSTRQRVLSLRILGELKGVQEVKYNPEVKLLLKQTPQNHRTCHVVLLQQLLLLLTLGRQTLLRTEENRDKLRFKALPTPVQKDGIVSAGRFRHITRIVKVLGRRRRYRETLNLFMQKQFMRQTLAQLA